MVKVYDVRVRADWRWPVVRSAGRLFYKGAATPVRSTERGAAEILSCPLLEATELDPPIIPPTGGEGKETPAVETTAKAARRTKRGGGGEDAVAKAAE